MGINELKKKTKDGAIRVKNSVGRGIDTFSGKAVMEQVVKYGQETDAVNTAIVTRIYEILDHEKQLKRITKQARNLAIVSIVLNVLCFGLIAFLFVRGK